jgi:hypothetical protein
MQFDLRQVWADLVLMYVNPLKDAVQELRHQVSAT